MSRWIGKRGVLVVLFLGLWGCDSGFSPEDAKSRCDQERGSRNIGGSASCVDDDAYRACIAAYEDCGEGVTVNDDDCPIRFSCDEEDTAQEEG